MEVEKQKRMKKTRKKKTEKPKERLINGEPMSNEELMLSDVDEAVITVMEAIPGTKVYTGADFTFKGDE